MGSRSVLFIISIISPPPPVYHCVFYPLESETLESETLVSETVTVESSDGNKTAPFFLFSFFMRMIFFALSILCFNISRSVGGILVDLKISYEVQTF